MRNLWESPRITGLLSNILCFTFITRAVQDYDVCPSPWGNQVAISRVYTFKPTQKGRRIHTAKRQISPRSANFIAFNEKETTKFNRVLSEKKICLITNHLKRRPVIFKFSILLSTRLYTITWTFSLANGNQTTNTKNSLKLHFCISDIIKHWKPKTGKP